MKCLLFTTTLVLSVTGCQEQTNRPIPSSITPKTYKQAGDIPMPDGYKPLATDSNSFANWLSHLPLKKDKTVYLYNGQPKQNQEAQFAVLDISVGKKDLQQCADAVMRLRGEYLFAQKKYGEIIFKDDNNISYNFSQPYTHENFLRYMDKVFSWCGTHSLEKQLKPVVKFNDIQPGDVLIKGGFPGHAVIVLRVAQNTAGHKLYMLAQSYMPAQDIHILINPNNSKLSPWYDAATIDRIETPEWTFEKQQLKRW